MHMINARWFIIRFLILAILFAFVYPFLPEKQKWQIQASVGISGADSLLAEYYDPPPDTDAMQFSIETFFTIASGNRQIVNAHDVRYVRVVDKVWGSGRLWEIHLRRPAIQRLREYMQANPSASLVASLGEDWDVPLDIPRSEIHSPFYVDPAQWSDEPNFVTAVLEGWYVRPYMGGPGMSIPIPDMM